MRRLHGRFMEKLAAAGARTVAWDVTFRTPSEFDRDFVTGAQAVQSAGGEVVIAVGNWRTDQDGIPVKSASEPGLSQEIGAAPGLRWGSATLSTGELVLAHMAVQRDLAPPEASFALQAVSAWRHPGTEPHLNFDEHTSDLNVVYMRRDPVVRQARKMVGTPDKIPLPSLVRNAPRPDEVGLTPTDQVGFYMVVVPEMPAFDPFTRGYQEVMTAPADELKAWCSGKLVLIGDVRKESGDWHVLPGGQKAPGVHMQAATIGALLSGRAFHLPNDRQVLALTAGFAALGVGVGVLAGRRWWLGTLAAAALSAAMVCAGVVLYRDYRLLVYPVIPVVSLILGAGLGWMVVAARGRLKGV
jgi:hypothetical protein